MTDIQRVYHRLFDRYGAQHWWPARTPFEIVIGAVLTQNTAWRNVERAIAALRDQVPLQAEQILAAPPDRLAQWLRPAGCYRLKARRLRAVCKFFVTRGGLEKLARWPTDKLRHGLLGVHGVGPETADAILLYVFHRPVFVADAYAHRLFRRLGLTADEESVDGVKHCVESRFGTAVEDYNEYHALIVRHGKEVCRVRPLCSMCCLNDFCPGRGLDDTSGSDGTGLNERL